MSGASLDEMMSQQRHPDAGGSAGRAIALVVLAVALGVFLLARGFDSADGDSDASGGDTNGASTQAGDGGGDSQDEDADAADDSPDSEDPLGGDDGPPPSTAPTTAPVSTHPPGEVKVATVNGTGESGRAGRTAEALNAQGFVTVAKNAAQSPIADSVIYYRTLYGDDAKSVARVLNASPEVLDEAPRAIMTLIGNPNSPEDLETYNIFVLIGTDDAIPDPNPPAG